MSTTQNSMVIKARPETIYQALTNPSSLEKWLAPGEMRGKVHSFDLRVGGGYQMSLFYPKSEKESRGKTSEKEDRFTARFLELAPNKKIVQAVNFDSPNPDFAGEMIMEVLLDPVDDGTRISFLFRNIPPGIRPEDNEAGTQSSLEKLARFVE
ncbi:MAG TPA: SRPBCC family protein [Chitinophagaceae bacterium]|nr:SRPBCC family protein [Chitinophagaceae bacterium]